MSVILGINAYHAGSSAAVVVDGAPVAAIAEERLNRKKYYAKFPALAIQKCLQMAGLKLSDVDAVALGRDPAANRAQKIAYGLKHVGDLPMFLQQRRRRSGFDDLKVVLAEQCGVDAASLRFEQYNVEHHLAHMASSYFCSDWDSAAGITIDGSGDFVSCMFAKCEGDAIKVLQRVFLPASIGVFYTMIGQFIGYNSYGDEGKVMGLAPLGKDTYADRFRQMVVPKGDTFECNQDYFQRLGATEGMVITEDGEMVQQILYTDALAKEFGPPRVAKSEITQRDMDLAFCLQQRFEQIYLHLCNKLHEKYPTDSIVISGGCALNSVANGKIFDTTPFRRTWIQPASGDEGLSLGAALYVSNSVLKEGKRWTMTHSNMGPDYPESEIRAALDSAGVNYDRLERGALIERTVDEAVKGNVTGWFQGRMEWGPRALGNRSIIAHPGLSTMKDTLNARIKHRESFRPFAPSVLAERQGEIFEHSHPSPFMLHVYKIRPEWRERLCAVNHVDNTGRLQSVARLENPLYYDLIKAFGERTGIPVILNTSFNENEPVVCRPEEAIDCYLRTKMDALAIGPFLCRKQ